MAVRDAQAGSLGEEATATSRRLHPDKCKASGGEDAFQKLADGVPAPRQPRGRHAACEMKAERSREELEKKPATESADGPRLVAVPSPVALLIGGFSWNIVVFRADDSPRVLVRVVPGAPVRARARACRVRALATGLERAGRRDGDLVVREATSASCSGTACAIFRGGGGGGGKTGEVWRGRSRPRRAPGASRGGAAQRRVPRVRRRGRPHPRLAPQPRRRGRGPRHALRARAVVPRVSRRPGRRSSSRALVSGGGGRQRRSSGPSRAGTRSRRCARTRGGVHAARRGPGRGDDSRARTRASAMWDEVGPASRTGRAAGRSPSSSRSRPAGARTPR